jgi:hypothetical protein
MRDAPRWLVWAHEDRDGRPTKVPRDVRDPARPGSATDPDTWGSFGDAWLALAHPEAAGLGFALGDGWAGVDLDGCRDADTGALAPEAQKIVETFGSYAEASPSGRGVHIIGRAALAPGHRCRGATTLPFSVEVYSRDRFLTVTGERLNGAEPVDITRPLRALVAALWPEPAPASAPHRPRPVAADDAAILDAAGRAKEGERFRAVYDRGEAEYWDGDLSRRDAWLCSRLAFWTGGDAERIERLVSASACGQREKWTGRPDYRQRTIAVALAGWDGEAYTPPSNDAEWGEADRAETGSTAAIAAPASGVRPPALAEALAVYRRWLLVDADALDVLVVLGAAQANRLPGDPVWLLDVAAPGWGKTETIAPLAAVPFARLVGTLTEAALLSGTARKERARDATGGLLQSLGPFGLIVVKDFGSVLSLHRHERAKVLAALREVYDGAWTRAVGTDGGRLLEWRGKAGVIAGVTPAIDSHHGVIGALGERFLMHRRVTPSPEAIAEASLNAAGREDIMRAELAEAVVCLMAAEPVAPLEPDEAERRWLMNLAIVAAQARAPVERDRQSREITLVLGAEAPTRLLKALLGLRNGMRSLGADRETAAEAVRRVALDCIPSLRRTALDYLAAESAEVETSAAAAALGYPTGTVRRALEELAVYGVASRAKAGEGKADRWAMAPAWRERLERTRTVPATSGGVLPPLSKGRREGGGHCGYAPGL